jgi:hypothetical protein
MCFTTHTWQGIRYTFPLTDVKKNKNYNGAFSRHPQAMALARTNKQVGTEFLARFRLNPVCFALPSVANKILCRNLTHLLTS